MRLTDCELRAMNSRGRRLLQRWVEFPLFRRLGLKGEGQDILEIGCGSGYGAVLLGRLRPGSYVGIDLMPEQIELAKRRPGLAGAEFLVMDAAEMGSFPEASRDCVVIFGMLHHVSKWREVLRECHRVLRPGGTLFLEEPGGEGGQALGQGLQVGPSRRRLVQPPRAGRPAPRRGVQNRQAAAAVPFRALLCRESGRLRALTEENSRKGAKAQRKEKALHPNAVEV